MDQAHEDVFTYQPLGANTLEIRLVTVSPRTVPGADILCELEHVVFPIDLQDITGDSDEEDRSSQGPVFSALSYTWGSSIEPNQRILLNGKFFHIRQNLYDFLSSFSLNEDCSHERLWIDQLSINQSDLAERSQQVSKMSHIFKKASRTLIWLGPSFEGSDSLMTKMASFEEPPSHWLGQGKILDPEELDPHLPAILRVIESPYWTRLWICQELLLSRTPFVQIGIHHVPWSKFILILDNLTVPSWLQQNRDKLRLLAFLRQRWGAWPGGLTWDVATTITRFAECEEPLDRVFGVFGLVKPVLRIKVDYSKSREEVVREVEEITKANEAEMRFMYEGQLGENLRVALGVGNRAPGDTVGQPSSDSAH
jgi:hypothetical protein